MPKMDPTAQAAGTVYMLRQRLNQMRATPEAFPPRRGADLMPPARDPLQGWKTVARTAALELVSVQEDSSPMKLTTLFLKNVSQKPITAISVAFGEEHENGGGQNEDCFLSACVLPGASYALNLANVSDRTLVIKAVVFEDGTGDGVQT